MDSIEDNAATIKKGKEANVDLFLFSSFADILAFPETGSKQTHTQ